MENQMKPGLNAVFPAVVLAAAMTVATICCAPAANAQQFTYQTERAAHPNLAKALDAMSLALKDLEVAQSDFGGNKTLAIRDMRRAIHSARKALYFRMKLDDAAIDRAP
jgi:hypothetical protein